MLSKSTQQKEWVGSVSPTPTRSHRKTWMSYLSMLMLLLLSYGGVQAQLSSNYNFAKSKGSYSAITTGGGATAWKTGSWNYNDVSSAISIPTVNFNGSNYSSLQITGMGYVVFGSTVPNYDPNPLSSGAGYSGVIAANAYYTTPSSYGSPSIMYQQVGSEFVIQWQDAANYYYDGQYSFQIRLNTCNGIIKMVYDSVMVEPTGWATSRQVGLRGSSGSDFMNRTCSSGTWYANDAAGSNNYDYCYLESSGNRFDKGLTYTYTPPGVGALAVNTIQYSTASVLPVAVNSINNEIFTMAIDVQGSTGTLKLDTVVVTSNNTADADVSAVKLYASSSSTFSTGTATQIGSSTTFSGGKAKFNTLAYNLICGTTYIYVVYNTASGATLNDYLDAKINAGDIHISGTTYPSSNKSPFGNRQIQAPITYTSSAGTQANTMFVQTGATQQVIMGLTVDMSSSGSASTIDSIIMSTVGTNGTNNATTNISNAKIWYTGNSSTFATTTQYASTIASPNGSMVFVASQNLATNTNYFWLTYDINGGANAGDSVDAKLIRIRVGGTSYTPSTPSPAGYRKILPAYCTPNHSWNYSGATGAGITNVTFGGLNVTTVAGGTSSPGYSSSTQTAVVQRKSSPVLSVTAGSYGGSPIGIVCWMDLNQDGDFNDAGENVVTTPSGNATASSTSNFTIPIPCNVSLGTTQMRVMLAYYGSSYWSDPCITYGYGETEDYLLQIIDSPLTYASSTVNQTNTLAVGPGTSGAQIIGVPVIAAGCNGSLNATSFTLNTNGSTSNSDISGVKIYYTGNSNAFATTTQFGSTYTGSLASSFNITGTRALVSDTNWFWIAYDINSGATIGNVVDAECTSVTVGGNAHTPSSTAPSGTRVIDNPMTFNSVTGFQPSTSSVGKGTRYNQVLGIQVNMTTGSSVNMTQLKWATNGTNNTSSNVDTARIYYTGNSSTFAQTTLFGTFTANPAATTTYTINSTRALLPGNNYFWVAYSIKAGANTGDSVDARVSQVTVDGSPYTPVVTDPTGKRKIIPAPCAVSTQSYNDHNGITNVSIGNINNTSGLPTSANSYLNYSDYTVLSTDVQKSTSQTLSVDAQGYGYLYLTAWCDWNQDGTFSSGEKMSQIIDQNATNTTPTTYTFNFDVPCSAANGQARLRVRQEYFYYSSGYVQDPCNDLYGPYYNETEDYTLNIVDSPLTVVSSTTLQDVTLPVSTNTNNNQIVRVQVVAKGCSGSKTVTSIDLNTTGCSDPQNDIDSAYIYYTGNSSTFATTTLFGKVGSSVLGGNYSITGSKTLLTDTNNFWLVYKIASGATINDYVDAQCTNLVISTLNYTPTISSPSGNRQILNPMTYSSSKLTQTSLSGVTQNSTNRKIAGLEIVMNNGTGINVDSLIFANVGTQNVSTNITNVRCYYTGNSSTFASTTQYGSTQTSFHGSGGEIWLGGTLALLPGTNYFWLTYDINSGANIGDSIDGKVNRIRIAGTNYTPSPATVPGARYVIADYCTPQAYYNYASYGLTNVTLGSINNNSGVPSNYTSGYSDYTSISTQLNRNQTYTLSMDYSLQYAYGNVAAWLDYNGDGDFADAGEKLGQPYYSTSSYSGTVTLTFTVPCSASVGQTRLRIREEYYSYGGQALDPCNYTYYYAGEVEDYTIDIQANPLSYVGSVAQQNNTSVVGTSTNNNEVISVVIDAAGCGSGLSLSQMNFNTTGTTAPSTDITNAKLWWTGSSPVFATTTQIGSTVASPNGNFNFSSSQALSTDSNYFWLTYNVNSVTVGNKIDAQCTGITLNSGSFTPSVQNPAGDRTISSPATYNTHVWSKVTTAVGTNTTNNNVTKVKITMNSGAAVNLDSLVFNTTGNTSSSDVTNANVWYTGSSNAFATTTQYGSTIASPNGTLNFVGTAALNAGDNYFWFSYDIPNSATTGDSVNANLTRVRIGATGYNASPSSVSGKSKIRYDYCAGYNGYYYDQYGYQQGITNVTIGGINNSSGVPSGYSDSYSDYTSMTGNIQKSQTYSISVSTVNQNWGYSGYTTAFIDYDGDGVFQSTENVGQVATGYYTTGPDNITFTVPCNTIVGSTRMRLVNEMYYTATTQDPCYPLWGYMGEVEDYTVNIADMNRSLTSSIAAHPTVLDVQPGTTNQKMLSLRINSVGCSNNLNVSQLNFSTSGTSGSANPTTNITNAKVWYTGNSPVFATTTQYGSTATGVNGAFSVNGSLTIANDSEWFWLTYDVASGANIGDDLDAKITSMVVSSSSSTPTNNNPTGKRTINNPATYTSSSMTMPSASSVGAGTAQNQIVRLKITLSSTGSPVSLDNIKMHTTGCTDPSNDISNAQLFYTGSSTTFSNATQYGSTIASPNGAMDFTGTMDLNPGDNYLFLTYDINSYATIGNVVTATFDSSRIGGTKHIPSNTTVGTTRAIRNDYCAGYNGYWYGIYGYHQGMDNVTVAGINHNSGIPTGNSDSYSDFTAYSGNVQKSLSYTLSVSTQDQNWGYSSYTTVWIDYDGDGIFQSGENVGQVSSSYNYSGSTTNTLTFRVPCTAVAGATRMRLVNEMFYTQTTQDPCNPLWGYLGEVEDYTINIADSPRNITATHAFHPSILDVQPSTTNAQMMGIRIDAAGCGNQTLTNATLNTTGTNGSNNTSTNITNAKLWYTNTNVFATTTQYGSTISSPSGSMSFSGSQVVDDSSWLWLTYDVASGANIGDTLDAKVTSLTISSNTYNPSNSNPTGSRVINNPATYVSSTLSMPNTSPVASGVANQSIIRLQVNMSATGSQILADQIDLNTTGCDNTADITTATLWYTGSSSGFATTTQYGSAISSPSGTMTFIDNTVMLSPGVNYFYLAYDIDPSATAGDSVTAQFTNVTIASTSHTPSSTTVSTKRKINPAYCTHDTYMYNQYGGGYVEGITNVTFGGINNTTSAPSTSTTNYDYTNLHASLQKSQTYTLSISIKHSTYLWTSQPAAWCDWNNDGTFQSTEKLGEGSLNSDGTVSFSVNVPCSVAAGTTRLRVVDENHYYGNGYTDPCNYVVGYSGQGYVGEVEDYSVDIIDSARGILGYTVSQPVTTAVGPGSTNAQIMKIRINSGGCSTVPVTQFNFSTNGSTSASDIANAKVWYTGTSNSFATTTQFGSTVNNPSGNFSVTGSLSLAVDSAWFWLTYDIASGATYNDYVDADGAEAVINGSNYGSVSTVTGNRQIVPPASYTSAATTQASTAKVIKGSNDNVVIGAQIVMTSGSSQNLTDMEFTTTGSQNVSTNISKAKCWYTGNSSTFAMTTQYGTTYNSPGYNVSFTGNVSLLPGTNYFWMTYDVPSTANTNDVVDGTFEQFDLDSAGNTNTWVPSNTTATGTRKIAPPYCSTTDYQYNMYLQTGITKVSLGTISNSTSAPTSTPTGFDYTSQSTTVQKAANYTVSVDVYSSACYQQYTAAWIDFNGDATWSASEMLGTVRTDNCSGTVQFNFTVPCSATAGAVRMRVRNEYYANNGQPLDPCAYTYYYAGETEDYTINIIDSPTSVVSVNTTTASTADVFANATNQMMIAVPVVVAGCSGTQTMTSMTFNTNGSSNASNDIASAKVWYTGNSNVFSASTQFGSTSSTPVGSFNVTGSQVLTGDTNWFWLSYNIANGATTSNGVDAECNSVTVSSNTFTPSTQAPSGDRTINVPMPYTSSTTTNASTSIVEQGGGFYEVVKVQVVMGSGAPINLTQLNLSTGGSTNASGDIDSARVYYTGTSSTFATTTVFGTYAAPNGTFNVTGTQPLATGTNYFWVTFKIKTAATVNDSVTAQCSQITVNGTTHTPSVTSPAGKRRIIAPYCIGSYSNDYHTQMYISRVKVSTLDNSTSYGSSYPTPYTYYSSLPACSLTVSKSDTVQVLEGYSGYPIRVAAFIDLNQDGDFADAGEKLGENTNVNSTSTFSNIFFTIPGGALTGPTRMRVRCQYYGGGTVTPCSTLTYAGETEDYNVYINPPSAPSAAISPNSSTTFCQTVGQVFTATPSNSAFTYTWKEGTTVKQTGTGTSAATFSYNPAYTGTFNITCDVTDQYSQTSTSAATSVTIAANPVGGTMAATSTSLCSGQPDTLSISGNSGTVQWQSKVGAGAWTDISGATTSTYVVQPTTTISYRCKSTLGSCGSAFSNIVNVSIGTTSVWIGAFSTQWAYGPNWCSGTIPSNTANVTIGTGTYQPVIVSTVYSGNLTINSGASVTINNGGVLNIGGTFTKNGTLTHNSGKIIFATPQTLPANNYYWLTLNGNGTYTLAGNTTITSNLTIASTVTVATAGYNLTVKRDVACDGIINGTGTLVLDNGTLNQTVSGNATLGNVKVNLGSSALAVRFYNTITITGKLDISGGFVVIYNNTTLTVGSTSTSTGDIKFNYSGAQIVSANSSTNTLLKILGNSSAPQITGANITTNANIYMDRPLGMKLGGVTTIGGTLTIVNGTLSMNGFDLSIGKTGSTLGNYAPSGATSFITNSSTSSGYLNFYGSSSAAQITNVTLGSQFKLQVNRGNAQNKGISMGNSFSVSNQVITQNGSIDLNGWVLTLGSSASVYEATAYPIFGSTGYIQTTRALGSALTNSNIAGLGLNLTTSSALGNTNIVRGHTVQSSSGHPSVKRYYTLTSSNATTIGRMIFNYMQPEFNGFSNGSKMTIAKSTNGGSSWTHIYTYDHQMFTTSAVSTANNISLAATATMFTVGDSTQGYAPSVVAVTNEVENNVQNVWPNPFVENLNILFTAKEEGNVVIRVTDMSGKTVKNLTMKVGQGNNTISISDMKELPAGAYMINIMGNDKVSTMRVVKANN